MDNRKKILETALRLFYAKGYDAVGVQEIVEQAGITKPTLYYYFGSKYGLLEAVVQEKLQPFLQELDEAVVYERSIVDTLYHIGNVYMRFAKRESHFFCLLLALFYSAKENEAYQAVRPYIVRQYDMLVQVFERAGGELGNMNGRQRQFAISFLGFLNHFMLMRYEEQERKQITMTEEELSLLIHQFLHGIYS